MDPLRLLEALCERHGLPVWVGLPLRPVVERALATGGLRRKRLLELVDARLARRAQILGARPERRDEQADQELLQLVARVLHDW